MDGPAPSIEVYIGYRYFFGIFFFKVGSVSGFGFSKHRDMHCNKTEREAYRGWEWSAPLEGPRDLESGGSRLEDGYKDGWGVGGVYSCLYL